MLKLINNLKNVSTIASEYITSNNNLCVTRTRKNTIHDALTYRLYLTQKGITQEDATIFVNNHKKKENMTSRQGLVKKEARLTVKFYKDLAEHIYAQNKKLYMMIMLCK